MEEQLEAEILALVARDRRVTPELRALVRRAELSQFFLEKGYASVNDWLAGLLALPRQKLP